MCVIVRVLCVCVWACEGIVCVCVCGIVRVLCVCVWDCEGIVCVCICECMGPVVALMRGKVHWRTV